MKYQQVGGDVGKVVQKKVKEHLIVTQEFRVVGLQFRNGLEIYGQLKVGDRLTMEREDGNRFDAQAVKVLFKGEQIGYVEKALASNVRELMNTYGEKGCYLVVSSKRDSADLYNKLSVVMYGKYYTD